MRQISRIFNEIMGGIERRFKRTTPQFAMLLLAVVGIYFVLNFGNEVVRAQVIATQIAQTERDTSTEQLQNARLREQLDYYKSDAYAEQEARDSLNLRKPGETIIIPILPSPAANQPGSSPPAAQQAAAPTEQNWQRWLNLFGKE